MALQLIGQSAVSACFQTLFQGLSPIFNKGLGLLWGVNDELRRLERELSAVQDVLADAERRSISEKGVKLWITDLRELAYDMEDVIDEMNTESLRLEMEAKNHPSNYDNVSGKITSMMRDKYIEVKFNVVFKGKVEIVLQKLGEIAKRADYLQLRRESGGAHLLSSRGKIRSRETGPSVDVSEVYGRREEIDGIVRLLLAADDASTGRKKYDVISIVGIGGIGKTTLAKMIFQDKVVKSHFDLRSWACVSDDFNVARVTKDLIECAAKDDRQLKALCSLQDRLEDIVRDKKFLLVLDDVWSSEEWDKLKAPLSHCKKGSKVLVTTRSRKIAKDMSRGISCDVGNLDDESCWALFQGKAFGEKDANVQDEKMVEIGRKIVVKCQGVPLAVEMLGSYLRGAAEEKWECILNHDLWQVVDNETGIFPALKISYHVLPSSLKRCFEYFSLFPSDFIFDKKELVHMWIAENFVEAKEGRLLEDIGKEYYEDLQNRSLIQMDNKLHDLVHNLACLVSDKFYCRILSETRTGRPSVHSRHASFWGRRNQMMETHFKSALEPEHFRTIMLSLCNASELLCNLSNFRVLRVLRLTNSNMTEVPDSIGDLKLLRYLDLSFNSGITDLPSSICCLRNLQVLQLEKCINLVSLPNSIGNLQNLRHLNLSFTAIPSLPNSICYLVKLQSLYLHSCGKLTCLPETIGDLQCLQELNCDSSSISSFPNSISKIKCLRFLENINADGSIILLSPHVGKLTQLRHLGGYSVSNQMGCGIEELNGMNCLKGVLYISNLENVSSAAKAEMADLKRKKDIYGLILKWAGVDVDTSSIRESMEAELKLLEALEPHTAGLTDLRLLNYKGDSLPGWMSQSPLPALRCLEINGLRNVVGALDVRHPSLEELKIGQCIHLDEIFVAAPKLRLLEVDCCEELKSIHVPPSLKELKLKQLHRLTTVTESNIFRSNAMHTTRIFPAFPRLNFDWLIKLATWISSNAEDPGEHVQGHFPRLLENLEICYCHSLRALSTKGPPPSMMLKRVFIIHCKKLESLFNDAGSLPVTIEKLEIVGCPLLNWNLQGLTSLEWLQVDKLMQPLSDWLPDALTGLILSGESSSDDTRFISCVAQWLRNSMTLKALAIFNFSGLRTIQIEGFPLTIEFLDIHYCPSLDFIPNLQPLTSLAMISIKGCPRLVSLSNCRLPLSLKVLFVLECENLRFLPVGMHDLNSLEVVVLDNCPQLEIRPDDYLAPHQELHIRDCPDLEQQLRDQRRKDLLVLMRRYTGP